MSPHFRRIVSRFLPFAVGAILLLSAGPGPDALCTVAQTALLQAQRSLELCQIGIVILRVCGI